MRASDPPAGPPQEPAWLQADAEALSLMEKFALVAEIGRRFYSDDVDAFKAGKEIYDGYPRAETWEWYWGIVPLRIARRYEQWLLVSYLKRSAEARKYDQFLNHLRLAIYGDRGGDHTWQTWRNRALAARLQYIDDQIPGFWDAVFATWLGSPRADGGSARRH